MPNTKHLDRVAAWAATVPPEQWVAGPPPQGEKYIYAVRTATGRVLTGTTLAFGPRPLQYIEALPKYGKVLFHIVVGD